jgi:hypothetical protein
MSTKATATAPTATPELTPVEEKRQKCLEEWRKEISGWDWFIISEKSTDWHYGFGHGCKLGTRNQMMNRDWRHFSPDARRRHEYCFEIALCEVAAQHGLKIGRKDDTYLAMRDEGE